MTKRLKNKFNKDHSIDWVDASSTYMSNWISSGMGMGTGGIPTTDNIPETTEKPGCPTDNTPETTEKLGCPTDNIPETTEIFGYPTDNIPETTEKLGYPTDNIPDNRFFKTLNFIIFIWNKTKYV